MCNTVGKQRLPFGDIGYPQTCPENLGMICVAGRKETE